MTHRAQGMTLIELMIALAIGALLMIAAIGVFMQSRTTFRVTESVSRLQENARFALEAIEPDIRMAHYWGLTADTALIEGRRPASAAAGLGTHTCGNNWNLDLDEAVDGNNNTYAWACRVNLGAAAIDSDTLVVRRASEEAAGALTRGTLYLQSTRSQPLGQIFAGTAVPAGYNAETSSTHRLIVNGYFVSQASSVAGLPSLRRKTLQPGGSIVEEEVAVGVENLQVQFGVDTDGPGTHAAPNANRGAVDRFVNPDDPIIDASSSAFIDDAAILAVRVWLRVRGEQVERGLVDSTRYAYADRDFGSLNDGYRRVVVSKTIFLRNARTSL